jgi:hypothetical protein
MSVVDTVYNQTLNDTINKRLRTCQLVRLQQYVGADSINP